VEDSLARPEVRLLLGVLRELPLRPTVHVAAACTGTFVLAQAGLLDGLTATRTHAGDLGAKLVPVRQATDVAYAPKLPGTFLSNELRLGNNGIMDIRLNPAAPYPRRLLVMGDSFGRHIVRFLSVFFREIVYLRSPNYHAELADLFRPHAIVTQTAERYLASIPSDAWRTHFLLLPHGKGVPHAPPAAFTEALAALLAVGRAPYRRFVRAAFGTEPDVRVGGA
jgi:hypothetical protein